MNTRPTPTGYQDFLDVRLRHAPASRHTDPLAALDDMEGGITQPVVETIEQQIDGSVLLRVGVFSEHREPSAEDIAAIEGVTAELRFSDNWG